MFSLPIAYLLRDGDLVLGGARAEPVLSALPLMGLAALASGLLVGNSRAVWRYLGVPEILRLAQFAAVAILAFILGQFLVDRLAGMPRSVPPLQFLVMMFLLLASRIAYGEWLRWTGVAAAARTAMPILLVGGGDGAALLIRLHRMNRDPVYEPLGILCNRVSADRSVAGVPVLGDLAHLERVVANLRVRDMTPVKLVITRPHHEFGYPAIDRLVDQAHGLGIEVADLPDLMRFEGGEREPTAAERERLAVDVYPRVKRGFDILVTGVVLAFCWWLIALAALAVALFIQRPVLFVQMRPGQSGRPFRLFKFRTMRDPTDSRGRALGDAERTPAVGRLLRRTRIDELPQFFNVLKGDMAIIGPRPLLRGDLDAMPDRGAARSRTKPGVTGWAQVNGGHQLTAGEKLALDLWYGEHASFGLDLRILWRTGWMMVLGEKRDEAAIERALGASATAGSAAADLAAE
jgi:lipopolysaccharide/colanic/teichoic acid biosynthesis glycosyltransferase